MKKMTPVYIIDGSSFLYRAYYSIRPLSSPDGQPVNAVFGFCRMMRKLIDTYEPSHMVLVWDSKGATERHELYPDYKATREAAPHDLFTQKELIQEFAQLIGLAQLAKDGVEADDLMYSVARELEERGDTAIVVSSDKDMKQVLSEAVTILDPFKDELITKKAYEDKMGFALHKLPFYFALVGDSSDNIPGVSGIGPKGATKLVQQFDSLKELYGNLEAIASERTRALLTTSQDNAFLSEQLFTLRRHEVSHDRATYVLDDAQWSQAYDFFHSYGFSSLLKGVDYRPEVTLETTNNFMCVTTPEQLNQLVHDITTAGACALDTETTGLHPTESTCVGISVATKPGAAYYIPFGHTTGEQQLSKEQVIAALKPVCEDGAIAKYLHHAKFDALVFSRLGIHLKHIAVDTMLAASLALDAGERIGLKALSERYLGQAMHAFQDVVIKKGYKNFGQVPLADATAYAAADAHQTLQLVPIVQQKLQEKGMTKLFEKLEMPVMNILVAMEQAGIVLDTRALKDIDHHVTNEIADLQVRIDAALDGAYPDLNLNSPKQVGALLFDELKLPVVKKTAGKKGYSTDQEVLDQLARIHPVPGLIMQYREVYKIKSTYLDALGGYVRPATGAVHTTYNQTFVATGRLASSDPNMQNIPVDRYKIRSAFKPRPGHLFISADYSQIELRVLAHVSHDATLVDAFHKGQDIHALTAAGLFEVSPSAVTPEQRQTGKRINFSILYGLTAHGLSKDLGISHSTAQRYIDTFMQKYPGVRAWMDTVIASTKEHGYVETLNGRRRAVPGIFERNRHLYDAACRVAINTVAQGTAAELMKQGMVLFDAACKQQSLKTKMLLQIHDELLLEVPEDEVALVEPLVQMTLASVVSWSVPLEVSTRVGADWQEVTK